MLAGVWAAQTLREDAKRFERKMRDQLDTVEALEDAKCVPRGTQAWPVVGLSSV